MNLVTYAVKKKKESFRVFFLFYLVGSYLAIIIVCSRILAVKTLLTVFENSLVLYIIPQNRKTPFNCQVLFHEILPTFLLASK